MNRESRATLAQETLQILEHGTYVAPSGLPIDISQDLSEAMKNTHLYRPSDFPTEMALPTPQAGVSLQIEVTPETTLEAAQRLASAHPEDDILCLNFASAKNPGGGFLGGSQAQEESLARSSGLYACLLPMMEMYTYNRGLSTCLYSDYMIYSPHVPVFREDSGALLEKPYPISFLSVPAVNAGAIRKNEPDKIPLIRSTMKERAAKLLWVATEHRHTILVLGAWGCGVFGNEPSMVAELFAEELMTSGRFEGRFRQVVFAVYDRSADQSVLEAFRHQLRS